MEEVPGSENFFSAQLVFLALGFLGPESDVIKALGVKQDARSNIQTSKKVLSMKGPSFQITSNLSSGLCYEHRGSIYCGRLPPWTVTDCVGNQVRMTTVYE